jgi:hypothetical protein
MAMSRKNYIAIADAIAEHITDTLVTWEWPYTKPTINSAKAEPLIFNLITIFGQDNPAFSATTFREYITKQVNGRLLKEQLRQETVDNVST